MRLDAVRLALLDKYFPIGQKLRYYPEYHRNILFYTIILGYRVNGHFLYSRDRLRMTQTGELTGFVLQDAASSFLTLSEVWQCELLVPDTSESERSLDYVRRASIGRAGQFQRGNLITLLGAALQGGSPQLETRVERRLVLKEGPYAGEPLVFLAPVLETLTIADLRQKQRIKTSLPADLFLAEDLPPFRCQLLDFSEHAMRLGPGGGQAELPLLTLDERVIVKLYLQGEKRSCRFKGAVLRTTERECVIRITHLYREEGYVRPSLLDLLEIKTALINRQASRWDRQ
ncbi:MAG: PilZ domain-containing protein [Rhodocyclaceae bacterium]|nr:PilZ domain-containing protein [Rhodocyclaceae bacterium]